MKQPYSGAVGEVVIHLGVCPANSCGKRYKVFGCHAVAPSYSDILGSQRSEIPANLLQADPIKTALRAAPEGPVRTMVRHAPDCVLIITPLMLVAEQCSDESSGHGFNRAEMGGNHL